MYMYCLSNTMLDVLPILYIVEDWVVIGMCCTVMCMFIILLVVIILAWLWLICYVRLYHPYVTELLYHRYVYPFVLYPLTSFSPVLIPDPDMCCLIPNPHLLASIHLPSPTSSSVVQLPHCPLYVEFLSVFL